MLLRDPAAEELPGVDALAGGKHAQAARAALRSDRLVFVAEFAAVVGGRVGHTQLVGGTRLLGLRLPRCRYPRRDDQDHRDERRGSGTRSPSFHRVHSALLDRGPESTPRSAFLRVRRAPRRRLRVGREDLLGTSVPHFGRSRNSSPRAPRLRVPRGSSRPPPPRSPKGQGHSCSEWPCSSLLCDWARSYSSSFATFSAAGPLSPSTISN